LTFSGDLQIGSGLGGIGNLLGGNSIGSENIQALDGFVQMSGNEEIFQAQIGTEGRGHSCPFCGKVFRGKWFLDRHVRIHTGAKPYICNYCSKGFNQKNSLKSHIVGQHLNQNVGQLTNQNT
jgi:uncharacterized Zn-finger protein